MDAMTQAEYARHRGVSREAIGKAIKLGKIPDTAFKVIGGRRLIDPAAADFALGQTVERVSLVVEEDEEPRYLPANSDTGGLTKAKTATEVYRARLAQLEYEERIGRLLSIDDVRQAMEKCAASIVREIEQLPSNADELAAAHSRDGIQGLRSALKVLARQVRTALERNMKLLASEHENPGALQS